VRSKSAPPASAGTAGCPPRVTARWAALLWGWPPLQGLLPPVARSRFGAPPPRFRPPWGIPGHRLPVPPKRSEGPYRAFPPASGAMSRDFPPRARRPGAGAPGVSSPSTHTSAADPVHPGFHTRHLPSAGFDHPLDGLLPAVPGDGPSTAAASMGLRLQGLAPPGTRYPSRGLASPVVAPRSRSRLDSTSEVDSNRGGNPAHARRRLPDPCPLGRCPLQGFRLSRLGRGFPVRTPWHLRPEQLPTVAVPGAAQGPSRDRIGLSLSRLPALLGFCTFPALHAS
jgi:hypothetical protein